MRIAPHVASDVRPFTRQLVTLDTASLPAKEELRDAEYHLHCHVHAHVHAHVLVSVTRCASGFLFHAHVLSMAGGGGGGGGGDRPTTGGCHSIPAAAKSSSRKEPTLI